MPTLNEALNLVIFISYFTIITITFRESYRLPPILHTPSVLLTLLLLSDGVERVLAGSGLNDLKDWWLVSTAVLSVGSAGYFICYLSQIIDYLTIGEIILKYTPAGIGVFRRSVAPDGVEDLLWEERSEYALTDIGFDPLREPTWLGIKQPNQRHKLLPDYLNTLDTGIPILGREVYHKEYLTGIEGWYIQDVVPLERNSDRLLITWRNVTALKKAREKLEVKVRTDELTGVGNRYALQEIDIETLAGAFYIDLDRFKTINDSLGHATGDLLLCAVVDRLRLLIIEKNEYIIRLGGDEFCVLVSQPDNIYLLTKRAELILSELQSPYWVNGRELRIDASIGIADTTPGDLSAVLMAADTAMYAAKRVGGVCVCWSQDLVVKQARRNQITLELLNVRNNYDEEFYLYYQPIVDLHNPKHIVRAEALIRWQSADLGFVSPGEFIPIAEDIGEITRLTKWVLESAAKQVASWDGKLGINVNVSPWDLEQTDFIGDLQRVCGQAGIPVSSLALEVTERAVSINLRYYKSVLSELAALPIALEIDDFGTGDSSLERLLDTPWTTIKIDRCLIPTDRNDHKRMKICRAVAALCRDFEIQSIAEGIETEDQFKIMKELGVNSGQGYYFFKPLSASELGKIAGIDT